MSTLATIGTIATVVGVAGSLAATGYSLAGGGQPNMPDMASSSKELSNANAHILPYQRAFEAAANLGEDYTFTIPQSLKAEDFGIKFSQAGWYDANGKLVSKDENYGATPTSPTTGEQSGSKRNPTRRGQPADGASVTDPRAGLTWKPAGAIYRGTPVTRNADGTYTAHFKGYGKTDAQAQIATETAANRLKLAEKYDPQFIAEALRQQKEADPEAFAAREKMAQLIQGQIERPINSPVADMLQQQVTDAASAAGNHTLTSIDRKRLDDAVAMALADRGGQSAPADFSQPLTTGFTGEARQQNAINNAVGFLSSGSSPEDIAYRRNQQDLANLSAQINGKTPQSQFASMSAAQNGATPNFAAPTMSVMPNNEAGARSVAINNANIANGAAANQANPWLAGLSSLVNVGSTIGQIKTA